MHPLFMNLKVRFQRRINWLIGLFGLLIYFPVMMPLILLRGTDYYSGHHWRVTTTLALVLGIFMGSEGVELLSYPFTWTLPNHRKQVRRAFFILGLVFFLLITLVFMCLLSPNMPDIKGWGYQALHVGIVWVPIMVVPAAMGILLIVCRRPILGIFLGHALLAIIVIFSGAYWFEGQTGLRRVVLPNLIISSSLWPGFILALGYSCFRASLAKH